ncbi:MAG: branched-chain amino acid ABC transporter permease [Acidimicrobiales bacterium]
MPAPLARAWKPALIAAITVVYISAVGLVEQFADVYAIGTQVSLARVILLLPLFLAGWLSTRPRVERGERRVLTMPQAATGGAVTGLVGGAMVSAVLLVVDAVDPDTVGEVLIAVSTKLLGIVSFDQSLGTGIVLWLVLGALMGALGGVVRALSPGARRVVLAGPLTIGVLAILQRVVSTAIKELGYRPTFLYDSKTSGLTWVGGIAAAVIVTLAVVGRDILRSRPGDEPSPVGAPRAAAAGLGGFSTRQLVQGLIAIVVVLALPWVIGTALSGTVGTVMIFILLGLGLNIVVGFAGLLDLGYVAFFAFGAYTTAVLTGAQVNTTDGAADPAFSLGLNFYVAVPFVVLLAAGLGLLIGSPVLRLRGDYLAIVTLGLGEVVSTLVTSKWAEGLVGGPQGMRDITGGDIGPTDFQNNPRHFYYLALFFVLLALYASWRLQYSRVGRAWNAMREDEQVADAMGISTTRYKLLAFATGGAIGSLGGALLAIQLGSLTPRSFDVNVSILALAVVILGGLGSLRGVVVGAFALVGLPGFLREFEEFRPLALGAVIIAIMLLRPQGILPNVRVSEDIADEDREQDAWARSATSGQPAGEPAVEPAT